MAEKLRGSGYKTHLTGKWDAGCATPQHTPFGRGYDSFYGYFQHANDYWTKGNDLSATGEVNNCLNRFKDFSETGAEYRGGVLASCDNKTDEKCYEEYMFKEKSLDVIRAHNTSHPLFLFHSFHLLHTPLQVPDSFLRKIDDIVSPYTFDYPGRRLYAAMALYLDSVVSELVEALKSKRMWENTLLAFVSDNGGPIYFPGSANNHPLRGGKYSDFEGGIRTNAFVSGGILPQSVRGKIHTGVVSIADWFATFAHLAGADLVDEKAEKANIYLKAHNLPLLHPVDSVPQYDNIISRNASNRILHLSEDAVLAWPYKLIKGVQPYGRWTGALYPNCTKGCNLDAPWFDDLKIFDEKVSMYRDTQEEHEMLWTTNCSTGCLFNIESDPNEHIDLTNTMPEKADEMMRLLQNLNKDLFKPNRGELSYTACEWSAKNGGYVGPFIDADAYYTNPVPIPRMNETLAVLKIANKPLIQKLVVGIAQHTLPTFKDTLRKSFGGTCSASHIVDVSSTSPDPAYICASQGMAAEARVACMEALSKFLHIVP